MFSTFNIESPLYKKAMKPEKFDESFRRQLRLAVHALAAPTKIAVLDKYYVQLENGKKAGQRLVRYRLRCLNCGKTFTAKARAKYCDNACKQEAYRQRVEAIEFITENSRRIQRFFESVTEP